MTERRCVAGASRVGRRLERTDDGTGSAGTAGAEPERAAVAAIAARCARRSVKLSARAASAGAGVVPTGVGVPGARGDAVRWTRGAVTARAGEWSAGRAGAGPKGAGLVTECVGFVVSLPAENEALLGKTCE